MQQGRRWRRYLAIYLVRSSNGRAGRGRDPGIGSRLDPGAVGMDIWLVGKYALIVAISCRVCSYTVPIIDISPV